MRKGRALSLSLSLPSFSSRWSSLSEQLKQAISSFVKVNAIEFQHLTRIYFMLDLVRKHKVFRAFKKKLTRLHLVDHSYSTYE